jgi:hypothetical protein
VTDGASGVGVAVKVGEGSGRGVHVGVGLTGSLISRGPNKLRIRLKATIAERTTIVV